VEVGSDYGECTRILALTCRHTLGVDKEAAHVQRASEQYGQEGKLTFACVDVMLEPEGALRVIHAAERTAGGRATNVVFIDINGTRALEAVEHVLEWALTHLPGLELVVVKSRHMAAGLGPVNGERVLQRKTGVGAVHRQRRETATQ
jgi:hypothetical protein